MPFFPPRVTRPPCALPIQTAVASCGVKPQNHAFVLFEVVPVLPAVGRPDSWALVPVPPWTTLTMAEVASAATSAENAVVRFWVCLYNGRDATLPFSTR